MLPLYVKYLNKYLVLTVVTFEPWSDVNVIKNTHLTQYDA